MNPDHARFAEWDAAYVLGALSSSDRRAYEEHLSECAQCRRAVAELTPTVGLLSRVTAERAETIGIAAAGDDAIGGPEPGMRAGVISLAARRARGRRLWWAAAAAAVIIVAAVAVPVGFAVTAPPPAVAMTAVDNAPVEASLRLTQVAWGTRIELTCRYTTSPADAPADGWPYALAVTAADGTVSTVSTWRALPGATARLSAGTALNIGDVRAVEIVSENSGRVLMRYEPAADGP